MRQAWRDMLQDGSLRQSFSEGLMEASILMPPLYVGKADNLRARYHQHVDDNPGDPSDFHRRFDEYAAQADLGLSVHDLLFVCVLTGHAKNKHLRSYGLNDLLEQVVMRLSGPAFSKQ